jgi:hypothetical protein
MWPTIFEFSWDTGHMIFFGVFYAVVIVIATSIVYAVTRSIVDAFNGNADNGHEPPAEEVIELTPPETGQELSEDFSKEPSAVR